MHIASAQGKTPIMGASIVLANAHQNEQIAGESKLASKSASRHLNSNHMTAEKEFSTNAHCKKINSDLRLIAWNACWFATGTTSHFHVSLLDARCRFEGGTGCARDLPKKWPSSCRIGQ
jgi:hypothetical protein